MSQRRVVHTPNEATLDALLANALRMLTNLRRRRNLSDRDRLMIARIALRRKIAREMQDEQRARTVNWTLYEATSRTYIPDQPHLIKEEEEYVGPDPEDL